jgi:hypothetical protein
LFTRHADDTRVERDVEVRNAGERYGAGTNPNDAFGHELQSATRAGSLRANSRSTAENPRLEPINPRPAPSTATRRPAP